MPSKNNLLLHLLSLKTVTLKLRDNHWIKSYAEMFDEDDDVIMTKSKPWLLKNIGSLYRRKHCSTNT